MLLGRASLNRFVVFLTAEVRRRLILNILREGDAEAHLSLCLGPVITFSSQLHAVGLHVLFSNL